MKPLSGIKVLELATVVAAPTASRVLCDFGADVVKIESLAGDEMRRVGIQESVVCEDYKNPLFTVTNNNKKLISVNIKSEEGKEIIHKLLSEADVFVSNVRMASLERLGLDYNTIKDEFPKLIYAHFSGYGPKGTASNYPAFDSTAFWLRSGPMADWQVEGSFPMYPTYAFGDIATSNAFLSGILMAIVGREKTGQGTLVNGSLLASGIWCNSIAIIESQPQFGKLLKPIPERPVDPFSAVYECKDGNWIGFYCNEYVRDLEKFANLLGVQDIMDNPRCKDVPTLYETGAIEEVTVRVKDIMRTKTAEEWNRIFIENNVSNEIARKTCDVHKDEQAIVNEFIKEVEFADGIKVMMPMPPVKFSNYEAREYTPTGKIGEHTDEVLTGLGYSLKEITAMKEKNVIA